jgi:hypothetical protein
VLALAGFSGFTLLYSSGITGVTKKPNHVFFEPGCFCHGDSVSPGLTVWIEGPETLQAGTQAVYRVAVSSDSASAAGFNVAAFAGPLGIVDSDATQLMEPAPGEAPELTHILPRGAAGSDTVRWEFAYRAPFAAGTVDTLYANGNMVDLSGDPAGDSWNFAPNFLVTVVPVLSAEVPPPAGGFRLSQNYPNPFNPSTRITYLLPERAEVRLVVANLAGRVVRTLVDGVRDAGEHAVDFDAPGLASGMYVYRLQTVSAAGEYTSTRKMVLMK